MQYLRFLSFLHIKLKSLCSFLATSNRQNPHFFIHYHDYYYHSSKEQGYGILATNDIVIRACPLQNTAKLKQLLN